MRRALVEDDGLDLAEMGPEVAGPAYAEEDELDAAPLPRPWAPEDAEDLAELMPVDVFDGGMLRLLRQEGQHGTTLPDTECRSCGCTDARPCPGGCVWADARASLCSRCALLGGAP